MIQRAAKSKKTETAVELYESSWLVPAKQEGVSIPYDPGQTRATIKIGGGLWSRLRVAWSVMFSGKFVMLVPVRNITRTPPQLPGKPR